MRINESFLAIIPARKGSKGIAGKNLRKIGGKPMIQFTLEAAISSVYVKNILITSDDDKVISLAKRLGLSVPFKRPEKLSTDFVKTSDVIQHSLEWYQLRHNKLPDNIILLQPTSPFRDSKDIDLAIEKFICSNKDTLVSVTEPTQHPGDCMLKDAGGKFKRLNIGEGIYDRHSYPEVFFIDGGIYISKTSCFLKTKDLIGGDPEVFITSPFNAIDIDTPFDLESARAIYNYRTYNE